MQVLRKSTERGLARHGWLESRHSFSFADYYDDRHVQFGPLRVLNEDRVQGGRGFGAHAHRDMEILSYVLSGALAHRDSTGVGSTLRSGDVQRMSAGRGVSHSEFNASATEPVHFLQIWLIPDVQGVEPGYEERHFSALDKRGRLALIASPDRAAGSLAIHQDARVYAGLFDGAESATLAVAAGRRLYVHVAVGEIRANEEQLAAGDALMLTDTPSLLLSGGQAAEVLVFDLPGGSDD